MTSTRIQTERCTITPLAGRHLSAFMAYRNDMEWMRYQGFKGLSRQEYLKALDKTLDEGMQLAIEDGGRLIGDVYLRAQGDALWVGYTVAPAFARCGYASEAVLGVAGWAKAQGFRLLKAGVLQQNTASIGLLEKLGFTFLGVKEGELVYELVF